MDVENFDHLEVDKVVDVRIVMKHSANPFFSLELPFQDWQEQVDFLLKVCRPQFALEVDKPGRVIEMKTS